MNIYIFLFFCVLVFIQSSCRNSEPKYFTVKDLKGTWKLDSTEYEVHLKSDVLFNPRTNMSLFSIDSVFNDIIGFYKFEYTKHCQIEALGTETKFRLQHDTLEVWNTEREHWRRYKVNNVVNDTLYLQEMLGGSLEEKFVRAHQPENQLDFDHLAIFQKYIGCDDNVYILGKDGLFQHYILNKGKTLEFYSYNLLKSSVDSLFHNFRYVDITTLRDKYHKTASGYFHHFTLFFVKDGKVIKTIVDDGFCSPPEFKAGFLPIVGFDTRNQQKVEGDRTLLHILIPYLEQY